jgi:alkanesulfonate monooxygenase SsuD/methylene tetrahydromethanopterin reductase-like flavin-dependent oxidoreductase (luciferase family)
VSAAAGGAESGTSKGASAHGTLHVGVALEGAGWHPAAWRQPRARPAELLSPAYWVDLARTAEAGRLDFVTIEDSLSLQSSRANEHDRRTDLVRGRLDAVMIAARVSPLTEHIGLLPTALVTHTEPFHISKAIATLDWVSQGRAGVRFQVSGKPQDDAHFGRRRIAASGNGAGELTAELFAEAADYAEVVRRLWDSWEDDAEIRDSASGRFVDVEKLHYIDFRGEWFSVKGPSITPRPPQGQPVVAALAHSEIPYRFAAAHADVVFVTPYSDAAGNASPAEILAGLRRHQAEAGREPDEVVVLADLVVFLGVDAHDAGSRKDQMDAVFGHTYRSDAHIFVGAPTQLADLMQEWSGAGVQGFRLRPGAIPHDLDLIVTELVPELQRRALFRAEYGPGTLRDRFGWARPANRYNSGVGA